MKKLVHFALSALFLLGLLGFASAQNIPEVDVFAGYSYLDFDQPLTSVTTSERFGLNGWDLSLSVHLISHLAVEGDFSGHQTGDCENTIINCSNFSYMLGPRYNFIHSTKFTGFAHALVGRDRLDLPIQSTTVTDTSVAFAAGFGFDYWVTRHFGVQFGPADYFYTRHLYNTYNASGQNNLRASAGFIFRFGNLPSGEPEPPKAPKAPKEESEGGHRSWIRPWHKSPPATTSESQPATVAAAKPRPATPAAPPQELTPSHGMAVHSLGVTVAPQDFDGAKILAIEPGSIAEMASLHVGDLIKTVDGKAVKTPMELAAEMLDKTGKVRLGIQRGTVSTETVILLGSH